MLIKHPYPPYNDTADDAESDDPVRCTKWDPALPDAVSEMVLSSKSSTDVSGSFTRVGISNGRPGGQ
jgi:hypothetical protein